MYIPQTIPQVRLKFLGHYILQLLLINFWMVAMKLKMTTLSLISSTSKTHRVHLMIVMTVQRYERIHLLKTHLKMQNRVYQLNNSKYLCLERDG